MTHLSIRIVAFSVVCLLLFVNPAPYSQRNTFDIFKNPVKDFFYSINPTTKRPVTTTKTSGPNDNPSMIIVPLNIEDAEICKRNNTEMDLNGVCRQTWT